MIALLLIALVITLVAIVNFAFVACELSLVAHHYSSRTSVQVNEGSVAQLSLLKTLYYRIDTVARSLRVLCNLCLLAQGVLFFALFSSLSAELNSIGVLFSSILVAWFFQHMTGYILPRAYSLGHPDRVIRVSCRYLLIMERVMVPFITIGDYIEARISRMTGREEVVDLQELGMEAQVQAISQEGAEPTNITKKIIRNALRMSSLEISDVLLPRHQVQIMDLDDSLEVNLEKARKTGHTRFPLCEGSLDSCLGQIHIKDLFRRGASLGVTDLKAIKRSIGSLSIDEPLELAMERLLRHQMHMALVVDDFGGVVGVLTLESILEELVGEIHDEFDVEEALILPVGNGEYWISGLAPVHEVEEALGIEINNDEVSTIGGLITAVTGRIPQAGESIVIKAAGLSVQVEEVDDRRVIAVRVKIIGAEEAS